MKSNKIKESLKKQLDKIQKLLDQDKLDVSGYSVILSLSTDVNKSDEVIYYYEAKDYLNLIAYIDLINLDIKNTLVKGFETTKSVVSPNYISDLKNKIQ